MTTFIDFRYSRALAAALFAGQEKEETEISFAPNRDGYVALDVGDDLGPRAIAMLAAHDTTVATLAMDARGLLTWSDHAGRPLLATADSLRSPVVGLRLGPTRTGIRANGTIVEGDVSVFTRLPAAERNGGSLRLACEPGAFVLGRGTGRSFRWGQLFYQRRDPSGLCVELTMDWHHLRAGIPLFGTMTAEELVEAGTYRLRFRSYAHRSRDAQTTDFVRLFGCDADPDIAVHLAPALYLVSDAGLPNMAYTVTESENVHHSVIERCNRIDRTCVPSTYVRDVFRRAGVTRPLEVVHHGVDLEYFRPVARKAPLPGGRGFNFLAVGTHVERKNIQHLVRAFLEEFREHEDVALFLLLRAEYLTTQNNVALAFTDWERTWANRSAPILFWTGYVTREHLRDFYANAHAYVMPSNEGFGLTLLEAMACGTPAIGLRRGGVLDFVNDGNGILVDTGRRYVARDVDTLPYVGDVFYQPDIRQLRQAMRRLFEGRELLSRLSERARADAEQFSWRAVSQKFIRCVEQTHAEFVRRHGVSRPTPQRAAATPSTVPSPLTVALCIADDEDATWSLRDLRRLVRDGAPVRVMCLFTRYARLSDVRRARAYGFAYYRWDGTMQSCQIVARSLFGTGWLLVLYTGEQLSGDSGQLNDFLNRLPEAIHEVSLPADAGRRETRVFRVTGEDDTGEFTARGDDQPRRVEYPGGTIDRIRAQG